MDEISLRPFKRADWAWLQVWFQDEITNQELGPLDEEWLEHVLSDRRGVQLVAETQGQPVAIIGVTWGIENDPPHAITDLAVHPDKRRRGFGLQSVQAVIGWPGHPMTNKWIAFVELRNKPAQEMLTALGWREFENDGKMLSYELSL